MTNQFVGAITVLLCMSGYVLAFQYFRKGLDLPAILLIVLCGFLLRLFAGFDLYLHPWDERFHALVAKNLIEHPLLPTLYEHPLLQYNYRNWAGNYVWLHKQPLPLWTMASSMKLFGINEIALRLPSIILSTIGIYLTFYIGQMLFNRTVGFIAAFFYSINGLIILITTGRKATDHPDLFHLFFVELAVFLVIYYRDTRKNAVNILIGLALGAAILCKWLTALIVLPIWFILMREKEPYPKLVRSLGVILFFCVIVFLPWQIYIHKAFPLEAGWENSFNIRHITEGLDGHSGPFYYNFKIMLNTFGAFIYIPVVWFLVATVRNFKDERLAAIAVWFLIPYLFFTCVKTKMLAYTLFAAPSVFIILGLFMDHALKRTATFKNRRMATTLLILMFLVPALLYSFKAIKPFKRMDRNRSWAIELRNLDKTILDKNTVIFNSDHPIEAMFYSSFTAYQGLPTAEQVTELTQRGYKIYIMGKGYAKN